MYRALLLITALLLCACATEWHIRRSDNGKTALRLQSVRNSTLPENGLTFIRPSDLRAGDILFSSEGSIRSLGIRVFSNAAVSHSSIYLGDGKIAEAVGSGTRIRALDEALQETNLTVAFRRPDLTAENIQAIIAFAEEKNGSGYNHLGIALQAPFSIARNACELPVIPRAMRHLCLNALATITVPALGSKRLFCSQLVIEAFNRSPPSNRNGWTHPTSCTCAKTTSPPSPPLPSCNTSGICNARPPSGTSVAKPGQRRIRHHPPARPTPIFRLPMPTSAA